MTLLIISLLATLGISFLCSLMESVLYSTTSSYIESLEDGKGVRLLKNLKYNIENSIAAILSLNTIANTAGASLVGAQAAEVLGNELLGFVSAVLTVLVLVFSEIIPKTIGSTYWRKLCVPVAYLINGVYYLCFPLVVASRLLTKLIAKKQPQTVSREEVAALTKIGEREGVFMKNESKIINNLVKMETVKVHSIMTPRTVVLAAQEDMTLEEFFRKRRYLCYSRIPVYTEDIDDITGFVLKTDILMNLANGKKKIKLKSIKRDIMVCYENTSLPKFYDLLVTRKEHIALVIDEHGGMEGIVTMEDVVETILGLEITDESDAQTDMQAFAKALWAKRAKHLDVAEVEDDTAVDSEGGSIE